MLCRKGLWRNATNMAVRDLLVRERHNNFDVVLPSLLKDGINGIKGRWVVLSCTRKVYKSVSDSRAGSVTRWQTQLKYQPLNNSANDTCWPYACFLTFYTCSQYDSWSEGSQFFSNLFYCKHLYTALKWQLALKLTWPCQELEGWEDPKRKESDVVDAIWNGSSKHLVHIRWSPTSISLCIDCTRANSRRIFWPIWNSA